jgi:threonine synthase
LHCTNLATIGEGTTPLVASRRISERLGRASLFFKLESLNPSGSYKDRFVAAELTRILNAGIDTCVATSSGNTGASLAAYCARYGVACTILVNEDAPSGKLVQMRAHGARVFRIPGFVTSPNVTRRVLEQLTAYASAGRAALVVSAFRYCPIGMNGVKAIAREILAQLTEVRHVFVPVGGGGLFSAVSRQMQELGAVAKVHAVQPEGCPTLLNAFRTGSDTIEPVAATTRVSGLSVPFDIDAGLALSLLHAGGGHAFGVSDEEVFQAQRDLLQLEGIYSEPAGAAALAGYYQALSRRIVDPAENAVCLVTGHGFKDPMSIEPIAMMTPSITIDSPHVLAALSGGGVACA